MSAQVKTTAPPTAPTPIAQVDPPAPPPTPSTPGPNAQLSNYYSCCRDVGPLIDRSAATYPNRPVQFTRDQASACYICRAKGRYCVMEIAFTPAFTPKLKSCDGHTLDAGLEIVFTPGGKGKALTMPTKLGVCAYCPLPATRDWMLQP
jgi:hypothetical protein